MGVRISKEVLKTVFSSLSGRDDAEEIQLACHHTDANDDHDNNGEEEGVRITR